MQMKELRRVVTGIDASGKSYVAIDGPGASVIEEGGADAVAMAHVLHYGLCSISAVRTYLIDRGIEVCSHDESAHL